ncbi:hypothetical protein [Rhodoblastus sp.]|uniref:hypothetical protein n=1 Tax=Rhodoblastus sp. TaxID=1962975 RepID=UPI003F947705
MSAASEAVWSAEIQAGAVVEPAGVDEVNPVELGEVVLVVAPDEAPAEDLA